MGKAPDSSDSHSGLMGHGATPKPDCPAIPVFGERHTGTRAILRMLNALPHLRGGYNQPIDIEARPLIRLMKAVVAAQAGIDGGNAAKSALSDAMALAKPRAAGWKHSRLDWDDSFAALSGIILTQRNPYSWLIAMFARPYHHIGKRMDDLTAFITTPWLTIPRERMVLAVESPAALWTEKMRAAQRFVAEASIPVATLPLEHFLPDPVGSLSAALEKLGQSAQGLAPLPRNTKSDEPLETLQRRHKAEPWRDFLTASQVAAFNQHLDADVMAAAGYRIEQPGDFPTELSKDCADGLFAYVAARRSGGA